MAEYRPVKAFDEAKPCAECEHGHLAKIRLSTGVVLEHLRCHHEVAILANDGCELSAQIARDDVCRTTNFEGRKG